MKRALIYVRLSSYAGETDNSTSPERQEEECRAWCKAHGYEVVEVIKDLDVSGSDKGLRLDRPGLIRVRERWGRADVLVFSKLDRIARNVLDWTKLAEEARGVNTDLVSVAENLDLSTPAGRFIANILQAFAEMEAAMISQRLQEAVAFMVQDGRHRGGLAAFGWEATPRDEGKGYRLSLSKATAPTLREAIERTIALESTESICNDFNKRGAPSPEGKGWATDTLRKLMRRPILRGMQVHKREIVRGPDGLPIRPHEPIVTDDEWRDLQAALERRSNSGGWRDKPPALLTKIIVCDLCGRPMHNVDQVGKPGVFKCSRHGRINRCPGVAIQREPVQKAVEEVFLKILGDLQVVEEEVVESASAEMLEVEESLDAVVAKLRDVEDEAEEDRLRAQRRSLINRRKELRALPSEPTVRVVETGETYREVWSRQDDGGRRALLASAIEEVRVQKVTRGGLPENRPKPEDRIDIRWKGLAPAA